MEIILKNKQEINGSDWIEFNTSGTPDKYDHWAEDSKYLDEESYELISGFFKQHSSNLNYFGQLVFACFNLEILNKILQQKPLNQTKLKPIKIS